MIAAGAAPFAAGAVLRAARDDGDLPVTCLFRLVTGLPCPLCGGTRAFAHVWDGGTAFLSYNGFWVLFAVGLVLLGLLALFTRFSPGDLLRRRSSAQMWVAFALLGAGWAWALVQRGTIIGG